MIVGSEVECGRLARSLCGLDLPVRVLGAAGAWYIGTLTPEGLPLSCESLESWTDSATAARALETGAWTQRPVV